jgi:hypothetical protein
LGIFGLYINVGKTHLKSFNYFADIYSFWQININILNYYLNPPKISVRDYVMEPQVITTLLAFFQAGGQPERVIELLSGNYQGLGQYANLLGW